MTVDALKAFMVSMTQVSSELGLRHYVETGIGLVNVKLEGVPGKSEPITIFFRFESPGYLMTPERLKHFLLPLM